MTVNYLDQVATVGFSWRLLRHWRGSLQKAIWEDLVIFLILFFSINLSYRCIISRESLVDPEYKELFDSLCIYCRESRKLIPLSFLLGFYITVVVQRWWEQQCCLASPDSLAMQLVSYIPGSGPAREVRRTIIRLVCLSIVLTLRKASENVLHRFPDYNHFVEAGMLTEREKIKLIKLDEKTNGKYCNHLHPIKWAQVMLRMAFQKGLIVGNNDNLLESLSCYCNNIYDKNFQLLRYTSVPIPLLYTQVIIIAVYTYFLASLFGNQYLSGDHKNDKDGVPDIHIPIFTILEFIFYVGWLKVGSALINPFGDDDDDFNVDELIDRNLKMGLLLVEEDEILMEEFPLGILDVHPRGQPNILISAEWWETNGVLDIGRNGHSLGIQSIMETNDLERDDVNLMVCGENSARLTFPGENSTRLTVPRENAQPVRRKIPGSSTNDMGSSL